MARDTRASASMSDGSDILDVRVAFRDCLFLGLLVVLSLILYVRDLGLYSDDWAFLARFSSSSDQSLPALLGAFFPESVTRPTRGLYLAGLYWLFGFHDSGYHIVNGMVLTSMILLCYLALRTLSLPRILTLAVASVYALLPHYSTDRFWFTAFQANLSMAMLFLHLCSDLKGLTARRKSRWGWKIVALLSLITSVLAYEVATPLFLLSFFLISRHAVRLSRAGTAPWRRRDLTAYLASDVTALVLAVGYKVGAAAVLSERMTMRGDFPAHVARLFEGALTVSYGTYGVGLPLHAVRMALAYPAPLALALGVLAGLLVFVYVYRATYGPGFDRVRPAGWIKAVAVGVLVTGLGYAVFLTTYAPEFTPTGSNNRVGIAAALGVAMVFVGAIGWVSSIPRSRRLGRFVFAQLIALICVCGFVINNIIARFWIAAARQQPKVITALRQQFPALPSGTTLILDGICPYIGPGVVFETSWDVGGMLQVVYRDSTLRGDIVTPDLEVRPSGLYTTIYGETTHYPYDDRLWLYNLELRKTYRLTNEVAALRYFNAFRPDGTRECPAGEEGVGTRIL